MQSKYKGGSKAGKIGLSAQKVEKINETKSRFFRKARKVDKSPVSLHGGGGRGEYAVGPSSGGGDITTNPTDIERKARDFKGDANSFMPKKLKT